jgi:hypothetical protein
MYYYYYYFINFLIDIYMHLLYIYLLSNLIEKFYLSPGGGKSVL